MLGRTTDVLLISSSHPPGGLGGKRARYSSYNLAKYPNVLCFG